MRQQLQAFPPSKGNIWAPTPGPGELGWVATVVVEAWTSSMAGASKNLSHFEWSSYVLLSLLCSDGFYLGER